MLAKINLCNNEFAVSQQSFSEAQNDGDFEDKCSTVILSFNTFGEIDLQDEIDGINVQLAGLAYKSYQNSSTIFCGVTTQILGIKHISVVVCHRGKLVDIVDRTSNPFLDEYEITEKIKIFSTENSRLAVLVDKDVLIQKNWEKIKPQCDIVISIIKGNNGQIMDEAMRLAAKFELPFICLDDDNIIWKE